MPPPPPPEFGVLLVLRFGWGRLCWVNPPRLQGAVARGCCSFSHISSPVGAPARPPLQLVGDSLQILPRLWLSEMFGKLLGVRCCRVLTK